MVRWGLVFVVFEGVPLCQEVVVTLVTRLDPSGRVHGTGPRGSGQVTQRRVEGLLHVRHLLGEYVRQGALLEVVAAKVANLDKIICTYNMKWRKKPCCRPRSQLSKRPCCLSLSAVGFVLGKV